MNWTRSWNGEGTNFAGTEMIATFMLSLRAGERVFKSIKQFLEKRLKLKINEAKSACAPVEERQFLGYRLLREGKLVIAQHSLDRIKDKVRKITRRNREVRLETVISDLNIILRGWSNYFQLSQWPSQLESLDSWIRRKVRCIDLNNEKEVSLSLNF